MHKAARSTKMQQSVWARVAVLGLAAGSLATVAVLPTTSGASRLPAVHHTKFLVRSESLSGLGTVLTTAGGLALYTNVGDTQGNSSVASQSFASAWPPLMLPAGDVLFPGRGIVGLGTLTLPSGQVQVTWQGLPLYTFIKDTTAGTEAGNEIRGFVVAFVALQKKAHA